MPAEPNKLLRVVVPVVVMIVGIGVVIAGWANSRRTAGAPAPAQATTPAPEASAPVDPAAQPATLATDAGATEPTATGAEQTAATPGNATLSEPAPTAQATPTATEAPAPTVTPATSGPLAGLRALVQQVPDEAPAAIGDLTAGGPFKSKIELTLLGAGVRTIAMADYFETVSKQQHYDVQRQTELRYANTVEYLTSLSARAIIVSGQFVDLYGTEAEPVWRETGPGAFEALVVNAQGDAVLRITRRFSLRADSFRFDVRQSIENLSATPLSVEWVQYGPIELHEDISGYGLDMRRVRYGYLLDVARDASRQFVEADARLTGRASIIDTVTSTRNDHLWPMPDSFKGATELVWLAQTSRYFAFAVYPLIDDDAAARNNRSVSQHPIDKKLAIAGEVHAVVRGPSASPSAAKLLLQLTSAPRTIEAGASLDLSFGAYAGPLGRKQLVTTADPVFKALGLNDLVIYNLGGPCAWCTFQVLAKGLLWFLTLLHDAVFHDWALSIMFLVVCVRTVLHPLTRRSQIGMLRFGKQMQAIAPKQQKIRERYKDEPKRMQEEMIKLMREEKVNYAGALGCLPMLLQSPIWFALYAMLYFSFDLRHEPGFYGVFQKVSGGRWDFLGDLSVADHFVYFGRSVVNIPLMGHITGLNILPVLMGVLFWAQQKYLTPPPSAAMTPEQIQQQKIIRVMTVFLFPLLMYNAPSGLVVYFITNSTLGIIESRWIRAHADKLDATPSKPAGESMVDRWRKKVENTAAQRQNKKR